VNTKISPTEDIWQPLLEEKCGNIEREINIERVSDDCQ
jgi:hypothetical protein